jgi:hypothetical protein
MKSSPQSLALFTLLFTLTSSLGRELDLEKPSSELRRFMSDVIYEVEAGDREKYSKRLPEAILPEFHGNPALKLIAEKHLGELCELTGVKRVDNPASGQAVAKIGIYFGSQDDLTKVAIDLDRQITLDRGFTYWKWWDDKKIINRAVIFIATDKLAGPALEDRLIELLLSVFGFPSRSKEIEESCLSTEEKVLTSLQPLDKAILKFYYRAVPAGTKPREFDKIFREQWSKKP